MLRRKPAYSMRAFVVCGLVVAMMLPGAGTSATTHAQRASQVGVCGTILPGSVSCPLGISLTRLHHRDRRRARREEPIDLHPGGGDGAFVEVQRHGDQSYREWLKIQMRRRRMSQRQLAQQAGIDHSTISRLLRQERNPSLKTALAILAAFREDPGRVHITAQVERVLRSDERLDDDQVRTIMGTYLTMRSNGGGHATDLLSRRLGKVPKPD
jgi:transcriptional regulator with XRE-family HTH domain